MSADLDDASWPLERLAEALDALARRSGLPSRAVERVPPPDGAMDRAMIDGWVRACAASLGFEAEPVHVFFTELDGLLRGAAPAILRVPRGEPPRFYALVASRGKNAVLLTPSLAERRFPVADLRDALSAGMTQRHGASIEAVLSAANVAPERRPRARKALLREWLAGGHIHGAWILRAAPGESFARELRREGVLASAAVLFAVHVVHYLLTLGGWVLIGRGAFEGRLDEGFLLAWGLMMLTLVPLQMLAVRQKGRLSITSGALLKRRMLQGALRVAPDEVRHQGTGQFLSQVYESETLQDLARGAGFETALSVFDLGLAAFVLASGAGGLPAAGLLVAWAIVALALVVRYARARTAWAREREDLTHDLVERMVGHRTRLAQLAPERWHEGEDQAVQRYHDDSARMDAAGAVVIGLLPHGWLLLGVLGLTPALLDGSASSQAIAIGVGGVLLAGGALDGVVLGAVQLVDVGVAWDRVRALFNAATRAEPPGSPEAALLPAPGAPRAKEAEPRPLVEAHRVVFRYDGRGEPVLRGSTLVVRQGDRVLLEGPSGGGKSTLAAVLAGLRAPSSGVVLLHGLDLRTMGAERWRRRVAVAPQFHENHVLSATFSFNVLMGRRWPAWPEDLAAVREICVELGLGPLLDRMPGGLFQMVGETGWQLSHGERSRLYLARALAQDAELVILDESFAALDPENLRDCLRAALKRARALLVIAHP